jgi:GT2 family glycosyltransferase
MKHHVLTLTHNNLALTQKCIWSALRQDIPARVWAVDNGSSDGSDKWLKAYHWLLYGFAMNAGVSAGWNLGLKTLFKEPETESVLVVGNDTQLAPWAYRLLLAYNLPFVTGVASDDLWQINQPIPNHGDPLPLQARPDFSCFLMKREAWERVGQFNEGMKHYASDCDWHLRAHRMGIKLWKACVPFYHERSSTLRLASPQDRDEIQRQANEDRAYFYNLYRCLPGQEEYYALFRDEAQTNPTAAEGSLSGIE